MVSQQPGHLTYTCLYMSQFILYIHAYMIYIYIYIYIYDTYIYIYDIYDIYIYIYILFIFISGSIHKAPKVGRNWGQNPLKTRAIGWEAELPHRSWPPRRALEIAQRPGQLERPHYPLAARILGFRVQGLGFIIQALKRLYLSIYTYSLATGVVGSRAWGLGCNSRTFSYCAMQGVQFFRFRVS